MTTATGQSDCSSREGTIMYGKKMKEDMKKKKSSIQRDRTWQSVPEDYKPIFVVCLTVPKG